MPKVEWSDANWVLKLEEIKPRASAMIERYEDGRSGEPWPLRKLPVANAPGMTRWPYVPASGTPNGKLSGFSKNHPSIQYRMGTLSSLTRYFRVNADGHT